MKTNTSDLVAILRMIATCIEQRDSFEGNIQYSCMDADLGHDEWEISGAYRIGNREGQGGVRLYPETSKQTDEPEPPEPQ